MASAALVPLVVCFSNGLRSAARLQTTGSLQMSGRPSLRDASGTGRTDDGGATRDSSDPEATRDSSPAVVRAPESYAEMMAATPPAVDAPEPYAEMLTAAPTKATAGPQGSEGLRTIGLLLGAALAVGVGFLALGGDTSVLNSLTAYAADGGISAELGGISADLVQSFSLIFLSEIGDKPFF